MGGCGVGVSVGACIASTATERTHSLHFVLQHTELQFFQELKEVEEEQWREEHRMKNDNEPIEALKVLTDGQGSRSKGGRRGGERRERRPLTGRNTTGTTDITATSVCPVPRRAKATATHTTATGTSLFCLPTAKKRPIR